MSAGAFPQIPLGELTALPRPPAGFKGTASRHEGNGREGEDKRERERVRGMGKGREKWEIGGNSALVV